MTLQELKKLAQDVERVTLYRAKGKTEWEVWAYDFEGSCTLGSFGNVLKSARTGTAKTYASLDRAFLALRAMGITAKIEIDG